MREQDGDKNWRVGGRNAHAFFILPFLFEALEVLFGFDQTFKLRTRKGDTLE